MMKVYGYSSFNYAKNAVISLIHRVMTNTLIVGKVGYLCKAELLFSKESMYCHKD